MGTQELTPQSAPKSKKSKSYTRNIDDDTGDFLFFYILCITGPLSDQVKRFLTLAKKKESGVVFFSYDKTTGQTKQLHLAENPAETDWLHTKPPGVVIGFCISRNLFVK